VGSGINFRISTPHVAQKENSQAVVIPARAEFVVNTLRNVVLGKDGVRLCFVEHILAACALWGVDDLIIEVAGPEIPLADGSASMWIELFEKSGLSRKIPDAWFALKEPLSVSDGDRQIIALPSDSFSMSYLMDWPHPKIGKRWSRWSRQDKISEIAQARTFGSESEHQMLGVEDDFVSLTKDGFSKPLRYEDEPIRHKLLDLFGDLSLSGINPLAMKVQFISTKGGHTLDIAMAGCLEKLIASEKARQ
jgi:UDP-3-O-[3-hydroxymyristoyl] N-acetylglucosamine deacetylase